MADYMLILDSPWDAGSAVALTIHRILGYDYSIGKGALRKCTPTLKANRGLSQFRRVSVGKIPLAHSQVLLLTLKEVHRY